MAVGSDFTEADDKFERILPWEHFGKVAQLADARSSIVKPRIIKVSTAEFSSMVRELAVHQPARPMLDILHQQVGLTYETAAKFTRKATSKRVAADAEKEAARKSRNITEGGLTLRSDPRRSDIRGYLKLPANPRTRKPGTGHRKWAVAWRLPNTVWMEVLRLKQLQQEKFGAENAKLNSTRQAARGLAAQVFQMASQALRQAIKVPAYVLRARSTGRTANFSTSVHSLATGGKQAAVKLQVDGHPALNEGGRVGVAFDRAVRGRASGFFTALQAAGTRDVLAVVRRYSGWKA